jgi:Flp pilus assembly protein TadD/predicted O-methyltransferase YrrM
MPGFSSLIHLLMNPADQLYFRDCLSRNRPYFGPILWALQGHPLRHAIMQRMVQEECRSRAESPFHILEIGSWAGGSAITWAEALKKVHAGRGRVVCVDPWRVYFDPARLDPTGFAVYQEMAEALQKDEIFPLFLHNIRAAGHDDLILPFRGASEDVLPLFREGTFDMLFVDGDHAYQEVRKDLSRAAALVREGGILCGDDLERQLYQLDAAQARQQQENDYVLDPASGIYYHPGVTLAVGEFFGEVSCWEGFWAMRRRGEGWEQVQLPEPGSTEQAIPAHVLGIRATDYLRCAENQLENGHLAAALCLLERLCAYAPGDPAEYRERAVRLAERLLAESQSNAALALLEQVLDRFPDCIPALRLLGALRLDCGPMEESLRCLDRAAQLQPEDAGILNKLGEARYRAGRIGQAESAFLRACALAPDSAEIQNNLAVLHWNRGNAARALAHASQAVRAAPSDTNALLNFARILHATGQEAQAAAALEQFLAQSDDAAVREELARMQSWQAG